VSPPVVFLGPTLGHAEARQVCAEAEYQGPAAQNDVHRAIQSWPSAIGLIDGVFNSTPAVWHKEILWALHSGVPVYGAASLGALRAAECALYGMIPVGRIAEAYQRGLLTDDDEVAVAHLPAEHGYRAVSEAMVNIRATLAAAEAEGVLTPALRVDLDASAKALYYPERTWPRILVEARERGIPRSAFRAFRLWLPGGRRDVKRADALALLTLLAQGGPPPPPVPAFIFEPTVWWTQAWAESEG
jgi:hypothetical protein